MEKARQTCVEPPIPVRTLVPAAAPRIIVERKRRLVFDGYFEIDWSRLGCRPGGESGRGDGSGFTLPVMATSEVANRGARRSLK